VVTSLRRQPATNKGLDPFCGEEVKSGSNLVPNLKNGIKNAENQNLQVGCSLFFREKQKL
jgi:hypothetical protein